MWIFVVMVTALAPVSAPHGSANARPALPIHVSSLPDFPSRDKCQAARRAFRIALDAAAERQTRRGKRVVTTACVRSPDTLPVVLNTVGRRAT